MKKLLFLLLCLPLAFTACTEPDRPGVKNKEYNLKITSDLEMTFKAEGGNGVITFELNEVTRFSPVGQPVVEATCAAEWVTDLAVEENITFVVAANEGEARDAMVVVTYGEQSIEVAVKQAAKKGEEPEPKDVVFEAAILTGEYYGNYYTPDAGNYYIFFTDNGFDETGMMYTNSTYYLLDLYGPLYEGETENGYIPLPAGTYTLDATNSMASGSFTADYSLYLKTNDTTTEIEVGYEAGELVVDAEGNCTLNVTIQGVKHTVTFSGESTIQDKREVNTQPDITEMVVEHAYGTYFGDQYTPGWADNFYFFLSDIGVDADGWELPNGKYYRFDLYSEMIDSSNGIAIPYGTYTIDTSNSGEPGTIAAAYSAYWQLDESGWDYLEEGTITAGSVTFDESGVVAQIQVNGAWYKITYTGVVGPFTDASAGEGGGSEIGDGPYSTLYDDWYCNLSSHNCIYAYYGDHYDIGLQNFTFAIMPNGGEGDFVQFDVLAGENSTDIFGEYTISDSLESYTAYPGYIDEDYYMSGSWYYTEDGYTMAPFVDGWLSVVDNGDGTVTIEFDVYDDCDFNITGSWTGTMSAYQSAAPMRHAAKASKATTKSPVKILGKSTKSAKRDIAKF